MAEERPDEPGDLDRPPPFFPYEDGEEPEVVAQDYGEPVEVKVESVYAAQAPDQLRPFVVLTDGQRKLPIMIGPFEAQAILSPIEGQPNDRPLTHDLFRNVLDRLDATVERVVIDDMWSGTYYAKVYLRVGEEEMEIDSRPSDAIALALRFEAPIFIADGILERGDQS